MPRPVAWRPPPKVELRSAWAPNDVLDEADLWPVPGGHGPEDVEVDAHGNVYTGLDDGRVIVFDPTGKSETIGRIPFGGRPLGLALERDEKSLIVCDSRAGRLLRVELATGRSDVLVHRVGGRHLRFVNNPTIAADGTIFFSESTIAYTQDNWLNALAEHSLTGSVYAYDPQAERCHRIANEMVFANGVELSADGTFLVVADTGRYCLSRLSLDGAFVTKQQVFVPNLPGFPDNVSRAPNGNFWVAIPTLRQPLLDALLPRPALRRALIPVAHRVPAPRRRIGLVVEFDESGRLVRQMQSPSGRLRFITGVRERASTLYLGSLEMSAIGVLRLKPEPA